MVIWDSANPLAEEYVRACELLRRHDVHLGREWFEAYYNCVDFIHTGYSALSQTTQILLNDICHAKRRRHRFNFTK